tara:strand:- start:26719 stop:26943 length:225 start_codon:yes stop_codon:yes gene_type:complete
MKDWKTQTKFYSINDLLGSSIVSYYNEKKEVIHFEKGNQIDSEFEKKLKRLYHKDLTRPPKQGKKNKIPQKRKK